MVTFLSRINNPGLLSLHCPHSSHSSHSSAPETSLAAACPTIQQVSYCCFSNNSTSLLLLLLFQQCISCPLSLSLSPLQWEESRQQTPTHAGRSSFYLSFHFAHPVGNSTTSHIAFTETGTFGQRAVVIVSIQRNPKYGNQSWRMDRIGKITNGRD